MVLMQLAHNLVFKISKACAMATVGQLVPLDVFYRAMIEKAGECGAIEARPPIVMTIDAPSE